MILRLMITAVVTSSFVITGCNSRPAVVEETTSTAPAAPAPVEPPTAPAAASFPWGYEGEIAPENWANLNPDYAFCGKGKKQSPINLVFKNPVKQAPRMDFSYTNAQAQVDTSTLVPKLLFSGANQLLLNGKVYNLEHMEFHSPSEHLLSGTALSMEIQFVHKAINGGSAAVLSVFVIEGRENPMFSELWNQFTSGSGTIQLDASKLIPPSKTYYHYTGSLTSPPCTEGVEWIVYNTPAELSRDQIVAFRSKFTANNRPAQPLNGRKVKNH
ncbi:MAG: carbonic anhydrase family protein [Bdellovibrionaceae bacterium]|nr:carbonic anhydrase family protein [Pseudobdellovibrionaceae bacterium]